MSEIIDEPACVFLRTYGNELTNGYVLVTVHMIIRDNRKTFTFVQKKSTKSTSVVKKSSPSQANSLLTYQVLEPDTIILTDYPEKVGKEAPRLEFLFTTDSEVTTEYRDFDLYIQFCTKRVNTGKELLVFKGVRYDPESSNQNNQLNEKETDTGIVYFPDVI